MRKELYLDNAAGTPLAPQVRRVMGEAMKLVGNPGAFNDAGRQAAKALEESRTTIARFLGAHPDEIIFTSSGSESNTLALVGAALACRDGKHVELLTSPIEHASVLEPLRWLDRQGFRLSFAGVDNEGRTAVKEIERKLTKRTLLVSIIYASNEIGTIQPVVSIGKAIRAMRAKTRSRFPLFHVDACQAGLYLGMNVNVLGVDLLTFNGSKIYGPRGVGALYVRRGVTLEPIIRGGRHERGLRAGTPNVPAIVGFAAAVSLIDRKQMPQMAGIRDYFFQKLAEVLPEARVNGPLGDERLPNILSISIPQLGSHELLLELDKHGIRAGSGSACTVHAVEPSYVLKAIGVRKPYLDGALRFSLGRTTTKRDIDYVLRMLAGIVVELRRRYSFS